MVFTLKNKKLTDDLSEIDRLEKFIFQIVSHNTFSFRYLTDGSGFRLSANGVPLTNSERINIILLEKSLPQFKATPYGDGRWGVEFLLVSHP